MIEPCSPSPEAFPTDQGRRLRRAGWQELIGGICLIGIASEFGFSSNFLQCLSAQRPIDLPVPDRVKIRPTNTAFNPNILAVLGNDPVASCAVINRPDRLSWRKSANLEALV